MLSSTLTFRQIKHFLSYRDSASELTHELYSRHRKKLNSAGEGVPVVFTRTRYNNSDQLNCSNRPQILVKSSYSPVITSTNNVNDQSTTTVNHPTPIRNQTVGYQPAINAPDHSTPIHNHIRRRKRKYIELTDTRDVTTVIFN